MVKQENGIFFATAPEVGARLKSLRLKRRWTQPEMAAKLDMSLSNYSKIEVGARTLGRRGVAAVCVLFGVTSDWLLYGRSDAVAASAPAAIYPEPVSQAMVVREAPGITLREAMGAIEHQTGIARDRLARLIADAMAEAHKGG
jgi:transcriptional regulator with XRE-family HTH domain